MEIQLGARRAFSIRVLADANLFAEDGSHKMIDMDKKWSTTIVKELMELAGGDPWRRWKNTAEKTGQPVLPGEEHERPTIPAPKGMLPLPNLKVYRQTHPQSKKADGKVALDGTSKQKGQKAGKDAVVTPPDVGAKTGAAAVLP